MISANVADFIGFFKDYSASAESGCRYFFYGDIRLKMDSLKNKAKYPMMVLDQPRIRTRHSGSGWFNEYEGSVAIVGKTPNGDVDKYIEASGAMFELMGKLVGEIKKARKERSLGSSELTFVLNELDESLLSDHLGWVLDYRVILPCGEWGRIVV